MQRKRLGSADFTVSPIGLGTWAIAGPGRAGSSAGDRRTMPEVWPRRNHFALRRINRLIKFEAVLLNRQVDRSLAESARATGIGGWVDWRIDGKCYAVTAIGMFDKPGSNRTPIGDPGYRHRTTKCRIDRLLQCSVVIHPQHEMLHPDAGPSPTILRVDPCASTRMSQSRKRIGR